MPPHPNRVDELHFEPPTAWWNITEDEHKAIEEAAYEQTNLVIDKDNKDDEDEEPEDDILYKGFQLSPSPPAQPPPPLAPESTPLRALQPALPPPFPQHQTIY
ncbi:hypothetical protein BCR34DRAFT_663185 [Clohesyomyces aquaticus]|uniref:Uncharacterized protein n=1 Tax=Clohesyomyces aquaticus TaxID=1231657 RepID=A0A1Y1ZTF7_9PLEO|nr:hypothetical protein BCR34DRAFT_663185 [Clohesyomyces aquaticus]